MHDPTIPQVHVLGPLRITDANGVEHVPQGEPVRELLVQLALSGGRVHVEHAIDVLWPGLPFNRGRRRLRNVLARANATCGDLVRREGNSLVLLANTDVAAYRAALADAGRG